MTQAHPPPRVAFYARVSSDRQAKAGTIASQIDDLRQAIAAAGATLLPEDCYIDDGYSGSALVRPALERLRDRCAAGWLDRVYIHSPDRLARNYAHQFVLVEELTHHGVEVVFLNHPLDGSPEAALMAQLQASFAEYERTKILERGRRGRLYAARRGDVSVLSTAPYGYRYISKHQGGGTARYDIVEDEAAVVRLIFRLVGQQRWPLNHVCKHLQKLKIPSPSGLSAWPSKTVAGILHNPAYQGQAGYGKTRRGAQRPRLRPGRGQREAPKRSGSIYRTPDEAIAIAVPALIGVDEFAAAAEQLTENQKRQRQRREQGKDRYLLSGLVVCQGCGYAYYGKPAGKSKGAPRRRYDYYRCRGSDRNRFGGERVCPNRAFRSDVLEDQVWADVCTLLRDPQMVEAEYRRREGERGEQPAGAAEGRRKRRQGVERKLQRLIDTYVEGLVSKEEFEPRVRGLREQLQRLDDEEKGEQQQQRQAEDLRLVLGCWEELAQHVGDALDNADWHTKREIIRTLVKRIDIDNDEVTVVYRVDLPPFDGGPTRGFLPLCYRRAHAAPLAPSRSLLLGTCPREPDMQVRLNSLDGGAPIEVAMPILLVGRSHECDAELDDESIADFHCVLVISAGLLLLRSIAGAKDTRVNGQRVRRAVLLAGDELRLGRLSFRVEIAGEENSLDPDR